MRSDDATVGSSGRRIFLLSPARGDGKRARLLLEGCRSEVSDRLRSRGGAPLGELYAFMSGLYFRGKLAYARAFARPEGDPDGVLVMTPGRGLVPADTRVTLRGLRGIAAIGVDVEEPRFVRPLRRDARKLAASLRTRDEVILLGSIATDKYVGLLDELLGPRLRVPRAFVGRGDLSRGGLLLRHVKARRPLDHVGLEGLERRGRRPERLKG